MIPGEVRVREEPLDLNLGRERRSLVVVNDGDRPIQVGSHLHFPDANPALSFDRDTAQAFRLDIPAGTSVRFEPGVSRTVELVALGGLQRIPGLQIRGRGMPTHTREPRKVVPFGTPGAEPETPATASPPAAARVTEETPHDEGTDISEQSRGEEEQ